MKRKFSILINSILICFLLAGCAADKEGGTDISNQTIETSESEAAEEESKGFTQNRLTQVELKKMTEFVNMPENNGFLLSEYEKPENADLGEIFYNGANLEIAPLSDAERKAYEKEQGNIETDVLRLTTEQINEFLQKKMGLSMQEMTKKLNWNFLEEYDSYVIQHGDTNLNFFICTSGKQIEEGVYEIHCKSNNEYRNDCLLTLQEEGDSFRFLSNQYEINSDDVKNVWRIEEQSFEMELDNWGKVQFVSYAPNTYSNPYADVTFELQKKGTVVFKFPEVYNDSIRSNQTFVSVDAVSFQDYDKDGYKDVIIINSYGLDSSLDAAGTYQEARIYKGLENNFKYIEELSNRVNADKNNMSIAGIMEMIEQDEVDLSGLNQNVTEQLEIFAAAKEEWLKKEFGPGSMGYAVYDLDEDGKLELITQITQGTGLYSENHFYHADTVNGGVKELPQSYYAEYSEFELTANEEAYKDGNGIIYYLASDVTKIGYAEMYSSEGAYYLKDGRIYSIVFRGLQSFIKEDDSVEEIYYDTTDNEVTREQWEQLLAGFISGKQETPYNINWRRIDEDGTEMASVQEILRELLDSYKK